MILDQRHLPVTRLQVRDPASTELTKHASRVEVWTPSVRAKQATSSVPPAVGSPFVQQSCTLDERLAFFYFSSLFSPSRSHPLWRTGPPCGSPGAAATLCRARLPLGHLESALTLGSGVASPPSLVVCEPCQTVLPGQEVPGVADDE